MGDTGYFLEMSGSVSIDQQNPLVIQKENGNLISLERF